MPQLLHQIVVCFKRCYSNNISHNNGILNYMFRMTFACCTSDLAGANCSFLVDGRTMSLGVFRPRRPCLVIPIKLHDWNILWQRRNARDITRQTRRLYNKASHICKTTWACWTAGHQKRLILDGEGQELEESNCWYKLDTRYLVGNCYRNTAFE